MGEGKSISAQPPWGKEEHDPWWGPWKESPVIPWPCATGGRTERRLNPSDIVGSCLVFLFVNRPVVQVQAKESTSITRQSSAFSLGQ